ncbi:MAG TPA: hypothetical protein VFH43_14080 [Candidatus Kapabacteria bacterium]|nr:hypothetical protein [Candidatus Kapabacteria bacterium]
MKIILLVVFASVVASCAPTRHIVPLDEGEHSVSLALGGPLITYDGSMIPAPMITAAYGYGIDSNITVFGGAHITSALFGVIQADIGGRYYFPIWESRSLAGMFGASLNPAVDVWEGNFKVWPELMTAMRWDVEGFLHPYVFFGTWIELAGARAHEQEQAVNFMPIMGWGVVLQSTNWDYALEYKFIAPNIGNKGTVVEYRASGDQGAAGIYFSVGRRFGL